MIRIERTNSSDIHFLALVKELDQYLAFIDGEDAPFYAQFNKTGLLNEVVVAWENNTPVGCGAFKPYDTDTAEIKRMYVVPGSRNKGIATQVLRELEKWAAELKYSRLVLETGHRQPDAIHLYLKEGYLQIPNFGQYAGVENSRCFEKRP